MNRRPLVRRARRRLFPLQFEAMESRLLLATFVVTSTADSGPGTLRQAILDVDADSTPGDTIDFSIGSGGLQIISPLSALPEITNSGAHRRHLPAGLYGPPADCNRWVLCWIRRRWADDLRGQHRAKGGSRHRQFQWLGSLNTNGGDVIVADQSAPTLAVIRPGQHGSGDDRRARQHDRDIPGVGQSYLGQRSGLAISGGGATATWCRATTSAPTPSAPTLATWATASRSAAG